VGKTWLVRKLVRRSGRHLVEVNLERNPEDATLFADRDPRATVRRLEARFGLRITSRDAVLFLDEVQASPGVFAGLRWFAEEMPDLPVVAAGSLLDLALNVGSPSFDLRGAAMGARARNVRAVATAGDPLVANTRLREYERESVRQLRPRKSRHGVAAATGVLRSQTAAAGCAADDVAPALSDAAARHERSGHTTSGRSAPPITA
jgi:hypothetical protein